MPDTDDGLVHTHRVKTNGVELDVLDAGQGPLVVLCHGFPELAFSWRHQLPALAAAGYRALAPDQRGYGGSSRPDAVDDYDIVHLTDDIVGLLDWAGAERAVVVGHDWGSMVAWGMAQRHPDRVAGVVGMSVPFIPRGERPPIEVLRYLLGDQFFYILYFQAPGVADAELGADPARTLRRLYASASGSDRRPEELAELVSADDGRGFVERLREPETLPGWLSADELGVFVDGFTRSGFTGPINWYRNMDRNWELSADLAENRIEMPALFITGAGDPVLAMTPPSLMDGWVTDLRGSLSLDGAGHWVQQEKPTEVNDALLRFLHDLNSPW
jgi:pimeloyl-ACP methyl ester carboxylesterase